MNDNYKNHKLTDFITQLKKLTINPEFSQDKKIIEKYKVFEKLINELEVRVLPAQIAVSINRNIEELNTITGATFDVLKAISTRQAAILKLVENELKLVPINHYRKMLMIIGMSAFGLPIGVAIGLFAGNIGLLAVGLPLGMGVGIAVGAFMDKKAKQSGRQLNVDIQ